jgi:hypothetical protein
MHAENADTCMLDKQNGKCCTDQPSPSHLQRGAAAVATTMQGTHTNAGGHTVGASVGDVMKGEPGAVENATCKAAACDLPSVAVKTEEDAAVAHSNSDQKLATEVVAGAEEQAASQSPAPPPVECNDGALSPSGAAKDSDLEGDEAQCMDSVSCSKMTLQEEIAALEHPAVCLATSCILCVCYAFISHACDSCMCVVRGQRPQGNAFRCSPAAVRDAMHIGMSV